jgi:hypothetical protein
MILKIKLWLFKRRMRKMYKTLGLTVSEEDLDLQIFKAMALSALGK